MILSMFFLGPTAPHLTQTVCYQSERAWKISHYWTRSIWFYY